MSDLFFYPRGLANHSRALSRFETPPSYVGPVASIKTLSLAKALEGRMSQFSSSREINSLGSVRIDLSRDGTRQVITGRRIWPTSIYPSRKAGAAIACEGGNELLFAQLCEADSGIAGYASQAAHFTVRVDGRTQEYHADFARQLSDGTVEIVEIKPNETYLEEPHYLAKLQAVKGMCRALGWEFRTFFGEDLRRRTFFNSHVGQIQTYRFLRLSYSLTDAVLDRLYANETVNVGSLIEPCGSLQMARAVISALICRSVVSVDLTRRITSETQVRFLNRGTA